MLRVSDMKGLNLSPETENLEFFVAFLSFSWKLLKHVSLKKYRGADRSLAPPGRKQATAIEDFEFHISYL